MKTTRFLALFLVLALCFILAGCSQASSTPPSATTPVKPPTTTPATTTPAAAPAKSSIEGATYSVPSFSLVVPKGWEQMKTDKGTDVGVQIYKGMDIVQVGVAGLNMSNTEAQKQTERTAKQYKGTTPEKVQMFGREFWKTTYTAASTYQTSYLSMKDGKMISVKLAGKDHDKNETIKAILGTLKFNYGAIKS